jgi:cob(I)alamin adenosyltransferase
VVLNKIYTRTGDDGTTALGTGRRIPKDSLRIAAYGTVDETNAAVGMARAHLTTSDAALDAVLKSIQNDLFDLGADLCVPDSDAERQEKTGRAPLRIKAAQVSRLEAEIDRLNGELQPLRSFVLPGGTAAAAALHVARTVCRRAERCVVELARLPDEPVSQPALHYLNRLSDFLFVASRYVNGRGADDVLWVPGQNQ